MAINQEQQQLKLAAEVEELARTLAHSTRDVPHPRDSYRLLGELESIISHLAQVVDQLDKWHRRIEEGIHHEGEDGDGTGSTCAAAAELFTAATMLSVVASHIHHAHEHNSVVHWYQEPQQR